MAVDEHTKVVVKVADWLADGWDWDAIGAALRMEPDDAARAYGTAAEQYSRREQQLRSGGS
jgi:hypothetical protein